MRYAINFDKLVNRYVPYYMGGRKLILYLQSIIKPLQSLNDSFVDYAKETMIDATMTSQIFKFEWFLNRRLGKYFPNGEQITITNSEHLGVPIYYGNASIPLSEHMVLYHNSEGIDTTWMRYKNEKTEKNSTSFIVVSPSVDTSIISIKQYEKMLRYYIDKYRISNKTYIIQYTSNE
jgi:hypothetical protein